MSVAVGKYGWFKAGWPPGSLEARSDGCICPPEANQDGRGVSSEKAGLWCVDSHCPYHRVESTPPPPVQWEDEVTATANYASVTILPPPNDSD